MCGIGTVIQLATPHACGAIHILRVSGEGSLAFLRGHTFLRRAEVEPRRVYVCGFYQGEELIDKVLCFYMRSPASYTGEDMVELHCHGTLASVERICQVALGEGLELAEKGEFTRRAVMNGKMTIEQAEAMHAFILAGSDQRRQNALRVMEGKASLGFGELQSMVLGILSRLELAIEFPEEDIPLTEETREEAYRDYGDIVGSIMERLGRMHTNYKHGMMMEKGYRFLIMGRTNAGKSTLMNAMVRSDRVMVSGVHGTTRDWVSERVDVKGISFVVMDGAGLRPTKDVLEQEGIRRLLALMGGVDGVIYLLYSLECVHDLRVRLESGGLKGAFEGKKILYFGSKSDLLSGSTRLEIERLLEDKIGAKVEGFLSLLTEEGKRLGILQVERLLHAWVVGGEKEFLITSQARRF